MRASRERLAHRGVPIVAIGKRWEIVEGALLEREGQGMRLGRSSRPAAKGAVAPAARRGAAQGPVLDAHGVGRSNSLLPGGLGEPPGGGEGHAGRAASPGPRKCNARYRV